MISRFLITAIAAILLIRCIVDSDLPFPSGESQIVVNGMLNPDSLIRINLSRTKVLGVSETFTNIENGLIKLFENGMLIDTLTYEGDGNYFSLYKSKAEHHYKIIISGESIEKEIEAEDLVPPIPNYNVCFSQTDDNRSIKEYDVTVHLELNDLNKEKFIPWVEFISQDYKYNFNGLDTSRLITQKFFLINTNASTLDTYNSVFDNYTGYFDFYFYMRVSDSFANSQKLKMDIIGGRTNQTSRLFQYEVLSNPIKDQSLLVNVINCSVSYDRYLKSTMTNFLNTEFINGSTLFSGPVKIYSNIKNGVGIFAAYSPQAKRVNEYQCN